MILKPKKIAGALLGTIVEYYDYSLYGFSASIIANKFFPNTDFLTSLANVFAVYAVAYLAKPLGSLIFGRIGDYYGRKIALNITIIGIVVPTIIIGLLPEYSIIGNWSILILVLCRLIQGVFMGGEYDGAAIYVIEHLGSNFRYTASAITRTTAAFGLLLGIASTNFFNSHIFPEWGWRIPFLLSFPLALITVYYRKQLVETPSFRQTKSCKPQNILLSLLKQWRIIFMVALIAGGFGVTYQISIIFMKQYLPIMLPKTGFVISTFSVLLVVCFSLTMPIAGLCADRFGDMNVIRVGVVSTVFSTILLAVAINYDMINLALASCLLLAISIAPFNALAHGIIITGFKVKNRYSSISIGHTLGSMLMSSSANYICIMSIKSLEIKLFPLYYVLFFTILLYVAVYIYKNKFIIAESE